MYLKSKPQAKRLLAAVSAIRVPFVRLALLRSRCTESRWALCLGRSRQASAGVSLALHVAIFAAILINWGWFAHNSANATPQVVAIDLVTIADRTNLTSTVTQQELETPSDEPAVPAPQSPVTAQYEMKIFPQEVSELPPKPLPKTDTGGDGSALERKAGPRDAKIGDQNIKPVGDADAMTMSVPDALLNQIARCWQPHAGQGHPVTVTLLLDMAGAVEQPPQFAETVSAADPGIEAVRYAIYTCAPYKLPTSRFEQWHRISLTFDPRLLAAGHSPHP